MVVDTLTQISVLTINAPALPEEVIKGLPSIDSSKLSQVRSAGNLANHENNWRSLTSDQCFLNNVLLPVCHIDFIGEPPVQNYVPKELAFSLAESTGIDFEINSFLVRNIIVPAIHCPVEYLSTIFVRPKPSGRYRIVLNLSKLNESVSYKHFKMESLASALNLITQSCVMHTIDLQDLLGGINCTSLLVSLMG